MNGKRYLLDTNAIIQLLTGNQALLELLNEADYVATSIICEIEFLCFPNLSKRDHALFVEFIEKTEIVDISTNDEQMKAKVAELRSRKKIKLPDAIIAATAATRDCILLTADSKLLNLDDIKSHQYPLV